MLPYLVTALGGKKQSLHSLQLIVIHQPVDYKALLRYLLMADTLAVGSSVVMPTARGFSSLNVSR